MAERELLGGLTNTTLHFDGDFMHIEEKQDCEPILDLNARMRNERFSAASSTGEFQDIANIPMVVALQWAREAGLGNDIYGNEFSVVMEKKLKDGAFEKFLSAPKVRDPRVIIKGIR